MPIYEYQCQDCGGVQEEWERMLDGSGDKSRKVVRISDKEKPVCGKCGGRNLKRIMSRTSFSGFYGEGK